MEVRAPHGLLLKGDQAGQLIGAPSELGKRLTNVARGHGKTGKDDSTRGHPAGGEQYTTEKQRKPRPKGHAQG